MTLVRIGGASGEGADLAALDPQVRWRAAANLAQVRTVAAVEALGRALSDSEPFVRWEAARALGEVARNAHEPAVAVAAGQAILDAAASLDPGTRQAAADAVASWGAKGPLEPVLLLANDVDPAVRAAAVRALGLAGGGVTTVVSAALKRALTDAEPEVRRMAANAIAWCRDETATPALQESLRDASPLVRAAALRALSRLSTGGAEDTALPLLRDPDPGVRAEAIRFLRQHGSEACMEALAAMASDATTIGETSIGEMAAEARLALRRLVPWPARVLKR
ncbi:MAG: HEAT repeat domain-containing protein [Anaerolineae bacterium]